MEPITATAKQFQRCRETPLDKRLEVWVVRRTRLRGVRLVALISTMFIQRNILI